jgi:hypothetical protein
MTNKSARERTWRNIMVAAINEALRIGRLDLSPETSPDENPFEFELAGLPVRVRLGDVGWNEVSVVVRINPNDARSLPKRLRREDALARGWLERKDGRWLQTSASGRHPSRWSLSITNELKPIIASMEIEPNGYADHGRLC